MAFPALVVVSAFLAVAFIGFRLLGGFRSNPSGLPLPPGPKGKFLLGNTADLPPDDAKHWEHWIKFKKYGPVSSVSVMGQTIVIVNDYKATFDLLEKRSAIYSSRPTMVFGGEMCGWEHSMILQPYGESSRAYRRATHSAIGTLSALETFKRPFEVEIRRFLLRLLHKPYHLEAHVRTTASAVILSMIYAYNIDPHGQDPLVSAVNAAVGQFVEVCQPGRYMVDLIPALRYIPDWFPGAGFKRHARDCWTTLNRTASTPYDFVEKQLRNDTAKPSYLSKLISGHAVSKEDAHIARWTALSLYTGGADTTVSSIMTFFLTMTLHQGVQKEAQKELDAVLGEVRLPTFNDRSSLPYMEAVVKEVLRFHPVVPMSFAHVSTQADVYEGHSIPRGSMVLPNIWAMLHDPAVYSSPDTFNPERFLGQTPEPDPISICFGFGRRVCPGRHVANLTLWLEMASSLAVFDIKKQVNDKGVEITPELDFTPGVISYPAHFKCNVVPRSEKHAELIASIETEQPWSEHGDSRELDEFFAEKVG